MRTVIYLDVLLLVNFVVGAAFLLAAGLLFEGGHDFLGGGAFGAAFGLGYALYRLDPLPLLHALREPVDEGKNPFA